MRAAELLRLVGMNINQNKFKSIMTSIGIVAGAATIVLVIGIGQGGQKEVAEQFAELNAGAINITYEYEGEEENSKDGTFFGNMSQFFGNMFGGGAAGGKSGGRMNMGNIDSQGGRSMGDGTSGTAPAVPGGNFTPGAADNAGENGMPQEGDTSFSGKEGSGGAIGTMPGGDFAPGSAGGTEESGTGLGGSSAAPEANGWTGNGKSGSGEISQDPSDAGEADQDGESSGQQEETESETSMVEDRLNQENMILDQEDVEDIIRYVSGISGATISYSTMGSVEGGSLQAAQTYTVAGVKESFQEVSKLELEEGDFLTEEMDQSKEKICVLGASAAKEIFGSAAEAMDSTIYIDDRSYTVVGILKSSQTVSAGISPDTAVLIPYETGIKYITGTDIEPTITVIAQDVNVLSDVIQDVKTVLEERHVNASFTFEDSGSKMEAAQSSNRTLTMLLSAMAVIVFLVGGIGIMNVLFVSVKERTNEIGILKAIGMPKKNILVEFLIESAAISLIGGVLGVAVSFLIIPVATYLNVRVEVSVSACLAALGFAVLTGTVFGIYPAWKASRLEPVEALNAE